MKHIMKVLAVAVFIPSLAFGIQAQNPRTVKTAASRNQTSDANSSIRRSATSVIARSTALNNRKSKTVVARSASNTKAASAVSARSGAKVISGSANVARSATSKSGAVRSATTHVFTPVSSTGVSRAGKARATAVYTDVSKIGGGYSACHDAYATCMDQFCANADASYRRCFCSDRFLTFRETSDNLDAALSKLADFQNNNLSVIDKTAAEVSAMYSSAEGETAIKKDTSASQKALDEVGDILSGKQSKASSRLSSFSSGILNVGDFSDLGDIWSNSGDSVFGASPRSTSSLVGLEGQALYKRAAEQCASITRDTCSSDALFNLATTSYSVLINQDCNTFEKSLNVKKENVMQTVRQAESLLREARLEEYRAHNNDDINECMALVEQQIQQSGACGEGYISCLDYTNRYILNGEPTAELFDINSIAPVLSEGDLIRLNPKYNKMLEDKKIYVTNALDTCRSLQDEVWTEFKKNAIIRIAQAQDKTVEDFKSNCLAKVKECYVKGDEDLDWSSATLKDTYNPLAEGAMVVRGTCYDQVLACAAMWDDPDGCVYNRSTRKIEKSRNGANCGLNALLAYVDTMDSARVAQACQTSLTAKAKEMCSGTTTTTVTTNIWTQETEYASYPYGCTSNPFRKSEYRNTLLRHAQEFCALDLMKSDNLNPNENESTMNMDIVDDVIKTLFDDLGIAWTKGCEESGGVWYDYLSLGGVLSGNITVGDLNKKFYDKYYGGTSLPSIIASIAGKAWDWGLCLNDTKAAPDICTGMNGTYSNGTCTLGSDWYQQYCEYLTGCSWSSTSCVCTTP